MGSNITTAVNGGIQYRIPYTQRDFQSIVQSIQQNIPNDVPEWNDLQSSNYGIFILNTVAALVDWLSYYADRNAAENYVLTCISKSSIVNLLQLINYQLRNACPAYTTLRVTLSAVQPNDVIIPIYSQFSDSSGSNPFVTVSSATITAGYTTADIVARQGSFKTDNFTSDGTPQQRFILSAQNVADGPSFMTVFVGQQQWSQATNNTFVGADNTSQLFRLIINAITAPGPTNNTPATAPELVVNTVEFGDGLEGQIPTIGFPIRVNYLTTQGSATFVPAGAVNQVLSQLYDVVGNPVNVTVVNLQGGAGGDAAESLYHAKSNYPQQFRVGYRLVNLYDFEVASQNFPGVLMATCYDVSNNAMNDNSLSPSNPVPVEQAIPFYQVRIYVIPNNDYSSNALNNVLQQYLSSNTSADRQVAVLSPTTVGLNINIALMTYSNYDANTVKYNVTTAVQTYFTWTSTGDIQIGATFFSSRLITIIQQIPGVASLTMSVNVPGGPPSQDITPAYNQIFSIGTLVVTLPNSPL